MDAMLWTLLPFAVAAGLQLTLCMASRKRMPRRAALLLPLALFVAAFVCLLDGEMNPVYVLVSILLYGFNELAALLAIAGLTALLGIGAGWWFYMSVIPKWAAAVIPPGVALRDSAGPSAAPPQDALPLRRYAPQRLAAAYAVIQWRADNNEWDAQQIGVLELPEHEEFELHLMAERSECEGLLAILLADLEQIDYFVQKDTAQFDIAYIEIYPERAVIEYWGNRVNTEFGVRVFPRDNAWFCTCMGMREYEPPVCIAGGERA